MKVTLKEIAGKTGYSISTVSRVLSGKTAIGRISSRTAEEIIKTARDYNYFPNLVAQNNRLNKTGTIGLVLPSITNPYFSDIANSVIAEVTKNSCTTIVLVSGESQENEKSVLSTLMSGKVDGIIAVPVGRDSSLYEEINADYVPVVLVDRYFPESKLPYVTTNNYAGGYAAAEYLIMNGHKRIACIQGVESSLPNVRRVKGFRDALTKAGIAEHIVVGNEFSIQNGYLETKLLLSRGENPTAIFALSNTIMLGVVKAVKESALGIPEDISIVAFDNNMYMDYLSPVITRVSQSTDEMGTLAARLLFEGMNSKTRKTNKIELTPNLLIGGSVKNIMGNTLEQLFFCDKSACRSVPGKECSQLKKSRCVRLFIQNFAKSIYIYIYTQNRN